MQGRGAYSHTHVHTQTPALSPPSISPSPSCLSVVLPHLLSLVVTSDPRLRHGALHAVAEVTASLHSLHCSPSHSLSAVLGEGLVQQLVDLVPQVRGLCCAGPLCELPCGLQLESHGVFRGAVGECMRPAALNFIVKMSGCSLPVSGQPALGIIHAYSVCYNACREDVMIFFVDQGAGRK